MTHDDAFERHLQSWLHHDVEGRIADHLDEVLTHTAALPQRQPWSRWLRPGGLSIRYLTLLGATVLVASAIVGGALLGGGAPPLVGPSPSPSSTSSPPPRSSDHPVDGIPGTFSGTITYVSWDGPTAYSIWSVRGDGTGEHLIGTGECPSLSADGASMVFVSGRAGNVKGDMIAVKDDGSEQHDLPGVDAWTGAVSPDGSEVAWAKDVGVSSSATTEDYVGSEDELWVSPVSGGAGVRIVPRAATPNVSYGSQAWSPTGERIAFIAVDNATAVLGEPMEASIWILNIDGSELHEVGTASPSTSIAWSPDGRWLAYARDTETEPELVALAVDGSVERPVGAAEPVGRSQWSPDGRYLAFVDRDGVATVEMSEGLPVGAPHRGPAATPPTIRFDIGWSPDSRAVLIVETRQISDGTHAENFASRLLSIDPEFKGQPTLLLDRERSIGDFYGCPVTWSSR